MKLVDPDSADFVSFCDGYGKVTGANGSVAAFVRASNQVSAQRKTGISGCLLGGPTRRIPGGGDGDLHVEPSLGRDQFHVAYAT